jgi:hypothetical protein
MVAPITWAEATSPILWSNIGINWNTPAETGSASYGVVDGFSSTHLNILGVSASFGVEPSYSSLGVSTIPVSITDGIEVSSDLQHGLVVQGAGTFSADLSQLSTVTATMSPTITFGVDADYSSIGNMSFSEIITFSGSFSQTASGRFLWNPETDPTTTWAAVTDPTSTWSDVTDPSTIWTKVDYPN